MSEVLQDSAVATSTGATKTALRTNAIGLSGVLFQSITAMAPAAAVATAFTLAIPVAGASLPLSVFFATIACTLIAVCIGQLAVHIPSAGGLYTYISRALGAKTGFLSAWVFLIAQPLLLPLLSLVWGPYMQDFIKSLTGVDIHWIFWTLLGHAVLLFISYRGIQASARTSMILGTIEIGVILALVVTILLTSNQDVATFTPAYSPDGWGGIFQGMLFAFLAFTGFETAAPLGEETANPKRNIPRAVIYSALALGLFYVLSIYAGVIGWGVPAIGDYAASPAPWNDLGLKFWGAAGPVILAIAILNSALGNGNAGFQATSRVAYAMGRIGTLPPAFARVSKFATPHVALVIHGIVAAVVSVGAGLYFGVGPAFGLIATIVTLGLLILYFLSCVSSFVFYLRERRPEFNILLHVVVPVIPMVILLFVFSTQVYPIPPEPFNLALPILLGWLVLGAIYLFVLQVQNPAALERGKEVFLHDLAPEAATASIPPVEATDPVEEEPVAAVVEAPKEEQEAENSAEEVAEAEESANTEEASAEEVVEAEKSADSSETDGEKETK